MWAGFFVERHVLAAITIGGMVCDGMGGLYLAYDLLGGQYGPLRVLTRTVTYALVFIIGYGLFLGLVFGLVAGIGLGLALGLEYSYHSAPDTARMPQQKVSPLRSWYPMLIGFFRGIVLGLAAAFTFGWSFGIPFGLLAACGLVVVYIFGFSPTADHPEGEMIDTRPRLRRRPLLSAVARGLSTGCSGIVAGLLLRQGVSALPLGLKVGFVAGLVSAFVSTVSPYIEWWADHLPARRLGAFGTILLLIGLVLQSLQYLVTLFDVPVH